MTASNYGFLGNRPQWRRRKYDLPQDNGLTGQGMHPLPAETDADFRALGEKFGRILCPATELEAELARQVVLAQWRLQRLLKVEAVLVGCAAAQLSSYWNLAADDTATRRALGFQDLAENSKALPVLNRWLDRLNREYHQAMRTFLLARQPKQNRPRPAGVARIANARKGRCEVIAIDDPVPGQKPSAPSERPPEEPRRPLNEAA